jgi:FkbM family methyltransferase
MSVSVYIPVYNEIRFIRRTLESIVSEADEILISDFGSTDGTLEILEEFVSKYPKIVYAKHQNWQLCDRINWFFQNAHGKYVRLIGGHDMVSSGSTKSMTALLESDPDAVMVFSKYSIYLNSDYSLNVHDEMSDQWCRNLASNDPFIRIDSAIEHIKQHVYYGLYKYEFLRQFFTSNIAIPTDLACHLFMASKGKLLSDDTSFFFWMYPRRPMDLVSEFIRIAKTASNGKNEHPFYLAFAVVVDSYNIAKEMQKISGAPENFDKKILYHWLDYLYGVNLLNREIILDEMPGTTSGNEKIYHEVYNLIKEYQKNQSAVAISVELHNKFSKIKTIIKKIIKWILPYGIVQFMRAAISQPYTQLHNLTYSQNGEDVIISSLFTNYGKTQIKYLDIGTNDPILFSNTYKFYVGGSNGVCVEANATLIPAIKKIRHNDMVINAGVSANGDRVADFYMFKDDVSGLNTLDKKTAESIERQGFHKIKRIEKVPLVTINDLIKDNFTNYPDFLSIDIEGSDLAVLETLDFNAYPIPVICVETCIYNTGHIFQKNNAIIEFMLTKNYEVYADTYVNTIFVNKDWFYEKKHNNQHDKDETL